MRLTTLKTSPDSEGLRLKGLGRSLAFQEEKTEFTKIVKFSFDPVAGTLYAIKSDETVLSAEGFLTKESLGKGRKGNKGRKGTKGKDGKDGRDGKKGEVGCKGATGLKGLKGIAGLDAEDGPIGNQGKQGCPGVVGEDGEQGEQGDKGHQGEIGLKGISCIVGNIGAYGPDGNGNCVIQNTPPIFAYIWGDTSDNPAAVPPVLGEISFVIDAVKTPLVTEGDNKYSAIATIVARNFENTSRYRIDWSGTYQDDSRINPTVSLDNETLTLEVSTTISPTKSVTISGTVTALLVDLDTDESFQISTTYNFSGANSLAPPAEVFGVISETQTVGEGDTATFTLNSTDSKGVITAVKEDTEVRFSFGGATEYLTNSNEISRVLKAGESSTSITVTTKDVGDKSRSVVIQARGMNTVTEDSLTSTLNITRNSTTPPNQLVVPSTITMTEKGNDQIGVYNLKLQLKTPFSGDQSGSITVSLASGTAKVGQLSNGNEATLVSVEALTRRITFNATTSSVTIPIRYIDDRFTNGSRNFQVRFSDGSNIQLPSTINAVLNDDEESSGGGGGGGGCIARSSMIDTPNGKVRADLLTVGDYVISQTGVDSLSDHKEFKLNKVEARIEQIALDSYYKYLVVDELALTHDHPILVLKDKTFKWLRAEHVAVGDLIFKQGSWQPVKEIIERFETLQVVNFNVEPNDVYYANDILVHNAELNTLGQQNKR